jgi:hypothetical protein
MTIGATRTPGFSASNSFKNVIKGTASMEELQHDME